MTRDNLIEAILEAVTRSKEELLQRMVNRAGAQGISADDYYERLAFGPTIPGVGLGQSYPAAMTLGGADSNLTTTQRVLGNLTATRMRSHHAENSRVMAKAYHGSKMTTRLARKAQKSPKDLRRLKDRFAGDPWDFALTTKGGRFAQSPVSKAARKLRDKAIAAED